MTLFFKQEGQVLVSGPEISRIVCIFSKYYFMSEQKAVALKAVVAYSFSTKLHLSILQIFILILATIPSLDENSSQIQGIFSLPAKAQLRVLFSSQRQFWFHCLQKQISTLLQRFPEHALRSSGFSGTPSGALRMQHKWLPSASCLLCSCVPPASSVHGSPSSFPSCFSSLPVFGVGLSAVPHIHVPALCGSPRLHACTSGESLRPLLGV